MTENTRLQEIRNAVIGLMTVKDDVPKIRVAHALDTFLHTLSNTDEQLHSLEVALDTCGIVNPTVRQDQRRGIHEYPEPNFDEDPSPDPDVREHVNQMVDTMIASRLNERGVAQDLWETLGKFHEPRKRALIIMFCMLSIPPSFSNAPPVDFFVEDEIICILWKHRHIRRQLRFVSHLETKSASGLAMQALLDEIKDPRERAVMLGFIVNDIEQLAVVTQDTNNVPLLAILIGRPPQ